MESGSDDENKGISHQKKRSQIIYSESEEEMEPAPGSVRRAKKLSESESDRQSSTDENQEDKDPSTTLNDHINCEDNTFETVYRHVDDVFLAKYSGICRHPTCGKRIEAGVTKIIGAKFPEKNQKKPAWICANHYLYYSKAEIEANSKLDDEERTQSDEDFIDDGSGKEDESQSEHDLATNMEEIKKNLGKQTPQDKLNANKYINEHSRYQLQIHSRKNKALYTSPTERFYRHLRGARFDVGMARPEEGFD